jgi:hypothetical protein
MSGIGSGGRIDCCIHAEPSMSAPSTRCSRRIAFAHLACKPRGRIRMRRPQFNAAATSAESASQFRKCTCERAKPSCENRLPLLSNSPVAAVDPHSTLDLFGTVASFVTRCARKPHAADRSKSSARHDVRPPVSIPDQATSAHSRRVGNRHEERTTRKVGAAWRFFRGRGCRCRGRRHCAANRFRRTPIEAHCAPNLPLSSGGSLRHTSRAWCSQYPVA